MVTALVLHERIRTTSAKAKAIRRTAEKMVTRAGVDSVHNRRVIGRNIKDKAALAKLFTDIGPRFKERPGGYTRILKIGQRTSDGAEMVILEFVADELKKTPAGKKSKTKAAPKPTKAETSPKEEPATAAASESPAEPATPDADPSEEQENSDDN
jgi:large subunit ribosomal protein L17